MVTEYRDPGYSSEERKLDLLIWKNTETWEDLVNLTIKFINSKICHPIYYGFLNNYYPYETQELRDKLILINKMGCITTDSQPGYIESDDDYNLVQRGYLEFGIPLEYAHTILAELQKYPLYIIYGYYHDNKRYDKYICGKGLAYDSYKKNYIYPIDSETKWDDRIDVTIQRHNVPVLYTSMTRISVSESFHEFTDLLKIIDKSNDSMVTICIVEHEWNNKHFIFDTLINVLYKVELPNLLEYPIK